MMSFVEAEADVLLATNIVESGLDIPRANTMVVCWPEKFGLAQLHQLRGRVGPGGTRAFAYLLSEFSSGHSEKRLAVLEEFSKPGAGFAISERDLDLRGAGDLFSKRQSGHVQVFGPVLYSHLLKQASEKTDDRAGDLWVPDLNLPIAEMLPTRDQPFDLGRRPEIAPVHRAADASGKSYRRAPRREGPHGPAVTSHSSLDLGPVAQPVGGRSPPLKFAAPQFGFLTAIRRGCRNTFTGCAEQENCASELCLFARDAPDRRAFRNMKNRTGDDATHGRSTSCGSEHRDRASRGIAHIASLHNANACRNYFVVVPRHSAAEVLYGEAAAELLPRGPGGRQAL